MLLLVCVYVYMYVLKYSKQSKGSGTFIEQIEGHLNYPMNSEIADKALAKKTLQSGLLVARFATSETLLGCSQQSFSHPDSLGKRKYHIFHILSIFYVHRLMQT